MRGDFSVLNFDPREHRRGVETPDLSVLRNISGVLHQQGRIVADGDLTEGQLVQLAWHGQAGRDIIGAGVCAVPAADPQGFEVVSAWVEPDGVHVKLRPGRAWADGILTRLAAELPDPAAPVERLAAYFGPPVSATVAYPDQIGDTTRDAVILEVSEEELHGFQYLARLVEPALGGPDTAERAFVNFRIRLLRLGPGEDCVSILSRLRDDPSTKGRLTASLEPVVVAGGDCPVVGQGGYTGFEHCLYRIEIAETPPATPVRFKWSQWNGGLAGRGRFDATTSPDRVIIDAGRVAIVNCGVTRFYLEALQYDVLLGAWTVVYGSMATLNSDHDLELDAPATFGTLPATNEPVFFRLWNGIEAIAAFTNAANPVELKDGIRLLFDAPSAGNYRSGDYWTFTVRAGEIGNPQVLVDDAPPTGVVYHAVPLAEINWTGRRNTDISGSIEDCRRRFRPLTNQKVCCTYIIGDGVSTFGDFNSVEEAARHLPETGGELCLLPGIHRSNLKLERRSNVRIHGCAWRTMVLPRTETRTQPIFHFVDCLNIEVCDLDFVTYDGIAIRIDGTVEDRCRSVNVHHTRIIARTNAIRATQALDLQIAHNRLHLLDTPQGRAVISVLADKTLIERNQLVIVPFVHPPDRPDRPDDDPTRDPADDCAKPPILYEFPHHVRDYAFKVWRLALAILLPQQVRAIGGIHVRAGSEQVRILENEISGGAGNGITLGGDLEPEETPPVLIGIVTERPPVPAPATINVPSSGQFLALVRDERGQPVPDVDVFLENEGVAADRSDAHGMASIKAGTGMYRLAVSPQYRITRVTEARDEGRLVHAIVLAPQAASSRGFLYEITIEGNDVSRMGLSGIGFAARQFGVIGLVTGSSEVTGPPAALAANIDDGLRALALTPLLRTTDPVRDLVILHNRLHHNLTKPFTDAMRVEARQIGRGGVSLGLVDGAVISGNHIEANGASAGSPVCGVFIAYGDNLEITDNVLSANGPSGDVDRAQAGIRGGVYVRFAGARQSVTAGRTPALRVHDNRIDQPVGRALTALAFGPVSVANNHFSSDFSGPEFMDVLVGAVLILNIGGLHRILSNQKSGITGGPGVPRSSTNQPIGALAQRMLAGGETLFTDNVVRLGEVNRSAISQAIVTLDDLGYDSNTSTVYRSDPFFANALLAGDSLRATSSRMRETGLQPISMFTRARRMNMTVHNQADHCIVAMPFAGTQSLPTIDQPNQVLVQAATCQRRFSGPNHVMPFLTSVLAASHISLAGLTDDAFTLGELGGLARSRTAEALGHINSAHLTAARFYQEEAVRLAAKYGADHPLTQTVASRGRSGVEISRILSASAEDLATPTIKPEPAGSTIGGRVVNDRGQGLAGYSVELRRADDKRVAAAGTTDASGSFAALFDPKNTAALAKASPVYIRVIDGRGHDVRRDDMPLTFKEGAVIETTVVVPVGVVPVSVAAEGKVIHSEASAAKPPKAPATKPVKHRKPPPTQRKPRKPTAPRKT